MPRTIRRVGPETACWRRRLHLTEDRGAEEAGVSDRRRKTPETRPTSPKPCAENRRPLFERREPEVGKAAAADHLAGVVSAAEAQEPGKVDEQEGKKAGLAVDVELEEGVGGQAAGGGEEGRGRREGAGDRRSRVVALEPDERDEDACEEDVQREPKELNGRAWRPHDRMKLASWFEGDRRTDEAKEASWSRPSVTQ